MNSLYQNYGRSLSNVTLSSFINDIEAHVLCQGITIPVQKAAIYTKKHVILKSFSFRKYCENLHNFMFKKKRKKIVLKKISVKYMAYWQLLFLYLSIYLYINIVRFLLRSQDLTESFSEVPADVADIFPQGPGFSWD